MTTIGSSQISQSQIDAARNSASVQAPPAADLNATDPLGRPENRVLPPGGLSAAAGAGAIGYGSASLDGIDWDALAADLSTTETMTIQLSQIMQLLIETMSEMRKGQREAWMADAQNALEMGLNAADRMRESAAAKLACDVMSNGASIITTGIQMAGSAATLVKMDAVKHAVDQQADALRTAQARAMQAGQEQARAAAEKAGQEASKLTEVSEALPDGLPMKDSPIGIKPGDALKTDAAGADSSVHVSRSAGGAGKFDGEQAQIDAKQADLKMWVTQENSRLMQPWNASMEIFNKGLDAVGALSKIGAGTAEFFSGLKQAEAQEARARGEYYGNVGQVELDFANELRDNIKGALDTMKSVEASRHQAMQGIYNI